MELINKLRNKAVADRATADRNFGELVSRLAANDFSLSEREVTAALKSCGRTLDDLERDVAREKRIAELKDVVAKYPDASRELSEATEKAEAFNRERQAEFSRNREAGIVIHGAVNEARANFENIRTARIELEGLLGEPVELPRTELASPIELPEIV